MRRLVGPLVMAFASVSALGGQITPASMTATAQMQVKGGNLDGCGVRVVAVAQDQTTSITAVDFSFNLYRTGLALVKAGVREARMNSPKEVQAPKIRQIQSFWLRAVGKPASTPGKAGIERSDSPKGYLLYAASNEAVGGLFGAFFSSEPIQVGYRLAGEDIDHILSGTITEAGTEQKEVSQCLTELTDAMAKDVEANSAKGKN